MIITIITSTESEKDVKKLTGYLTKNNWDWKQHGLNKKINIKEAEAAASFGLSREDFTDTGEDLQELKTIVEGN